ncbi:hypothetical protein I7I48_04691 [Histoplasma ohiense]|nr:hypothetical protein I7I48_04691 [Histoplasma ohiense (nom. inval.)]
MTLLMAVRTLLHPVIFIFLGLFSCLFLSFPLVPMVARFIRTTLILYEYCRSFFVNSTLLLQHIFLKSL